MRCPYCTSEIHDQAVKCPHCERLLVPRPGWRRDRMPAPAPAGTAPGPAPSAQPAPAAARARPGPSTDRATSKEPSASGHRAPVRRGSGSALGLLMVLTGLAVGYAASQVASGDPAEPASGTPVLTADADELRQIAESQLQEIKRLKAQLAEERRVPDDIRPFQNAIRSCEAAFTLIVEHEGSLFGSPQLRDQFVRLANACLAPTDREIEPLR